MRWFSEAFSMPRLFEKQDMRIATYIRRQSGARAFQFDVSTSPVEGAPTADAPLMGRT